MLENASVLQTAFPIIVALFSIILHEIAHGYAAYVQGDKTAYYAGRLTLNPVPHIDMIGSVIVPLVAFFTAGTFFGWAKPVPYNIHVIRTRLGEVFVAAAGVLTNLLLAVVALVAIKILALQGALTQPLLEALFTILSINISLAVFNLIPIPPFDGMAILQGIFPRLKMKTTAFFNPVYLIGAILIASVLYSQIMPYIRAGVMALL